MSPEEFEEFKEIKSRFDDIEFGIIIIVVIILVSGFILK